MFYKTDFCIGQYKAKRIILGLATWVNVLDYSAAILPVTNADKSVDKIDEGYVPISELDEKVHRSCKSSLLWSYHHYLSNSPALLTITLMVDDPEIYDGAHVAVQVVGRRFQEEKVLALAGIINDALEKDAN